MTIWIEIHIPLVARVDGREQKVMTEGNECGKKLDWNGWSLETGDVKGKSVNCR